MIQIEWFIQADNSACCNFGKRYVDAEQEKWSILEPSHGLKSSIELQTIHVRQSIIGEKEIRFDMPKDVKDGKAIGSK
jgi:hypothetical protein